MLQTLKTQWARLPKNLKAAGILGAAIVAFMLLKATKPDAQVEAPEEPVFSVRALPVTPAPLRPRLQLYGTVIAPSRATLTAAVSADVARTLAQPGDARPRGELLIQLDPEEAEIALAQSRSDLQQAEAQLRLDGQRRASDRAALENERNLLRLAERAVTRAVRLRQKGLISESDLDTTKQNLQRQKLAVAQRQLAVEQADAVTAQQRAALAAAEARLQRAELDLRRTEIRAPFDAAVIRTLVAAGDRVNPGTPLIEIYDRNGIEVRAQVPNRHIDQVLAGDRDGGQLGAWVQRGERRIPARLRRVAASAGGGGQNAYFRVAEPLPIDGNVSIELELPSVDNAVPVPPEAVYDLSRVFKIVSGRLESVAITQLGDYLDESTGEFRLLIRGEALQDGDEILITQLPNAVTGLKVQTIAR